MNERYYNQIQSTTIITQMGQLIGKLQDIVIDPENGKVAGFLLGQNKQYVISPIDVLDFGKYLVISEPEALMDRHDIMAVERILNSKTRIINTKVYTKDNQYLGKVYNYAVNTHFLTLTKIQSSVNFLSLISLRRYTIPSSDIIEITKDRITVKNLLETTPAKKLNPESVAAF